MLEAVVTDLPYESGDEVALMINGLGGTPISSSTSSTDAHDQLQERGISVWRSYVGEYCTSLDMAGASVTLVKIDDELKGSSRRRRSRRASSRQRSRRERQLDRRAVGERGLGGREPRSPRALRMVPAWAITRAERWACGHGGQRRAGAPTLFGQRLSAGKAK